jgi:phosphoglucosamine mutase
MEDDDIAAMCRSLEEEFGENGRVLIRPSGTEPLVRVMIEGENMAYIKHKAELLAALIESRLGT